MYSTDEKTQKSSHNAYSTPADTSFIYMEIQMCNNAYHMTSKDSLVKYPHKCLFSPPKTTLIKAIQKNKLPTWTVLTSQAVENYLPDSAPSTDKR